ncbi:MAG TPA: hypothetical protein VFN68_09090 [Acidimicrobiales bacterium]|nr:hypothetical protein [Acidimicrobiales bacterium]
MSAQDLNRDDRSPAGADPKLEALLELWDGLEEESGQPNTLGITVLVGGVTYSGLLIPGRVWSRSMAELLRSAPENHQVRAICGYFDAIDGSNREDAETGETRRYLHLANVAIGLPNDNRVTSLLMRVRVADVSAWTVGTMGELAPFSVPTRTSS